MHFDELATNAQELRSPAVNHRAYRDDPTRWLGTCVQRTDTRRLSFRWLTYVGAIAAIVVTLVALAGCGGGDPEDFEQQHDVSVPLVDCSQGACK